MRVLRAQAVRAGHAGARRATRVAAQCACAPGRGVASRLENCTRIPVGVGHASCKWCRAAPAAGHGAGGSLALRLLQLAELAVPWPRVAMLRERSRTTWATHGRAARGRRRRDARYRLRLALALERALVPAALCQRHALSVTQAQSALLQGESARTISTRPARAATTGAAMARFRAGACSCSPSAAHTMQSSVSRRSMGCVSPRAQEARSPRTASSANSAQNSPRPPHKVRWSRG